MTKTLIKRNGRKGGRVYLLRVLGYRPSQQVSQGSRTMRLLATSHPWAGRREMNDTQLTLFCHSVPGPQPMQWDLSHLGWAFPSQGANYRKVKTPRQF